MSKELKLEVFDAVWIEVTIPDPEPVEGFLDDWTDSVHAVWSPNEAWWYVSGRNMGETNCLIVHPYQIDGLIALLEQMRSKRPEKP